MLDIQKIVTELLGEYIKKELLAQGAQEGIRELHRRLVLEATTAPAQPVEDKKVET